MPGLRQASQKQRRECFRISQGLCYYCLEPIKFTTFHVDHKKAWYLGGRTVRSNLVASCRKCNIAKMLMSAEDFQLLLAENGFRWRDRLANRYALNYGVKLNFSRDIIRSGVSCPSCGSGRSQPCKGVRGQTRRANHIDRVKAYRAPLGVKL